MALKAVTGRVIACDFCHRTMFLKYLKAIDMDGVVRNIDRFEKQPDDWTSMRLGDESFDLCPKCYDRVVLHLDQLRRQIVQEENVNLYRMAFGESEE